MSYRPPKPKTHVGIAMWIAKVPVLLVGTIVTALLSINFAINFAVPFFHEFLVSTLPLLGSTIKAFPVRPYVLLIINFIILIILILPENIHHENHSDTIQEPITIDITSRKPEHDSVEIFQHKSSSKPASPFLSEIKSDYEISCVTTDVGETPAVTSRPNNAVKKTSQIQLPPLEDEAMSMDATWEAIMARGKARKELKKTKTWEVSPPVEKMVAPPAKKDMRKSETFNMSRPQAPALRKEMAVVCDDGFTRKVEAFIKKQHDQLRSQRPERYNRPIDNYA